MASAPHSHRPAEEAPAASGSATMSQATGSVPAIATVIAYDGSSRELVRAVAVERPVQVNFGGTPFGVMMLTPQDLTAFAYGFSLTEGVIDGPDDIRSVEMAEAVDGIALRIELTGAKLHAHLARKRALTGRTSCGLCGIEDLGALPRASTLRSPAPTISPAAIERALATFDAHQPLNAETRAVHGAGWSDWSGKLLHVREDVGRHNALDKLIGTLLLAGIRPQDGFVVITSRASFEMVEKVAVFGARTLVAISAPTSLAIDRARALGLTLIGVARRDSMTVFHESTAGSGES